MNKKPTDISDLREIRRQIDQIDDKLLKLIDKRCRLSQDVGKIKQAGRIEIIDAEREADIMRKLEQMSEELDLNLNFIKRLWRLLLDQSYRLQKQKYT
jgi:chorismate mutase